MPSAAMHTADWLVTALSAAAGAPLLGAARCVHPQASPGVGGRGSPPAAHAQPLVGEVQLRPHRLGEHRAAVRQHQHLAVCGRRAREGGGGGKKKSGLLRPR